jgi:hypothetical protein
LSNRGREKPGLIWDPLSNGLSSGFHFLPLLTRTPYSSSAILVKLPTPMHVNLVFLSPSAIILFAQQHSISLSGILAGCAIYFVVCYLQSPWRKLPPGPRGLPILGNALQLRSKQLLNFMKWKQEFGPKVANSPSLSLMIVLPRRHFLPQCSWTAYRCRQ